MESTQGLLFNILALLAAAVLAVPLFHRLGIGPVLGYLVAGVVVGPHVLRLIAEIEDVRKLGEFGVVFLLFAIGLELKLSRLAVLRRLLFGLGSAQVVVTALALAAIGWAGGLPLATAVVVGAALAFSSTAAVLQMLMERGELAGRAGRAAFAVLLMQDLAVAPLLVLLTVLSDANESPPHALALAALRAAVAGGLIIGAGRFLVRPFLRLVASSHSSEAFTGAAVLVVLGTGWVTEAAGLSMALGAFLAGLLLAETEFRHQVEADIQPFRGFLLGLFFMTVGMSLDLSLLAAHWRQVLLLVLLLMTVKASLLAGLARAFRLEADVAAQMALLLAQGGEFAFVVFGQAMRGGLLEPETSRLLTLVVTASMMLTPGLAVLASAVGHRLYKPQGDLGHLDELAKLSGHVIVAGYGRVGQTVARLLRDGGTAVVALDLHADRVVAARAVGLPVFFADASKAEVFRAAGAERAAAVVLTLDRPGAAERAMAVLRRSFPTLPVYARARDHEHSGALKRAGATMAVPETVEASLQLGATVLRSTGMPGDVLETLLSAARHDDYAGLGSLIDADRPTRSPPRQPGQAGAGRAREPSGGGE
ncbi:MAG: cation:proton antiporter [Magnetospirillum sp.]|nr:cation:proton antiporter [Magnetospirillum sp.]